MTPKVSIIIPVYKTEQYLRECLDSVLVQTYTDWECLLIDDGSPDDCGAICDEYVSRDSRFRVFHKENGGVSSARNVGLDNCVGEYVAFVDSDDTIAPDYLEAVNDFEGDLMILGYDCLNDTESENLVNGIYKGLFYYDLLTSNLYLTPMRTPWAKIYKSSLIGNIRFDTSVQLGEDTLFCLDYYSKCSAAIVDSRYKYKYRNFPYIKKYGLIMPIDKIIDNVCKIYEKYEKLGVTCNGFVCFIYFLYRSIVEWNFENVNKWFGNPVIKQIYIDCINTKQMYYLSYCRCFFVATINNFIK